LVHLTLLSMLKHQQNKNKRNKEINRKDKNRI